MKHLLLVSLACLFFALPCCAEGSKKTVCLNMIVKNESGCIKRCLDSVKPLIDYWVIVDTGSTDRTREIIRESLKGIPGELFDRPWKNFGYNRNEALDLARGKADYCLFLDADDFLEHTPDFRFPPLTADAYIVPVQSGTCAYQRTILVRTDLPWRWEGVVHEWLNCPMPHTVAKLESVKYIDTRQGSHGQDKHKFIKDALVLEDALKADPNNSRYMFYLAQSYREAGEHKKALDCYETRIAMGGWKEEVYWSMIQAAEMMKKLNKPNLSILETYFQAYRFQPERSEAVYHMAEVLNDEENYELAYAILKSFENIPKKDQQNYLFRQAWIEDYGLAFQLSIAAYYVGQFEESLKACDTVLNFPNLPEAWRKHTLSNRAFAEQKLQKALK